MDSCFRVDNVVENLSGIIGKLGVVVTLAVVVGVAVSAELEASRHWGACGWIQQK